MKTIGLVFKEEKKKAEKSKEEKEKKKAEKSKEEKEKKKTEPVEPKEGVQDDEIQK